MILKYKVAIVSYLSNLNAKDQHNFQRKDGYDVYLFVGIIVWDIKYQKVMMLSFFTR